MDLFALIRSVRRVFDENDVAYFVEELKGLYAEFQDGEPFYEASRYLEAHRDSWKKVTSEAEAASLSLIVEERLATVMSYLGFMNRYTFASVRTIDVLKYRHYKDPEYNPCQRFTQEFP